MKKVFKTGLKKTREHISLFGIGDEISDAASTCRTNITLYDNHEAHIEGFKNIIEYTDVLVKLNLGKGCVTFYGTELEITMLSDAQLTLKGTINNLEFC